MNPNQDYIQDYISNRSVPATPEEIDAVQPFSQKLVEDYGYPKSHIRTRPQFQVKRRPSDNKKSYPVDIVVFSSNNQIDNNTKIIVECKAKTKKDGRTQLEDYLTLSRAVLGVWYNGKDFLSIRKYEKNGNVFFDEIPNIPSYGERLEDIGKYKRKDLKPPHNLIPEFNAIRNHLAGNAKDMTQDNSLATEIINIILCKLYDEKYTPKNDTVNFRMGIGESDEIVADRVHKIFSDTKAEYSDVFEESDEIKLDSQSIAYVVGRLQKFILIDAKRDVVADAFEVFIGPSLRGDQGQFFTPRNVVKTVINIIKPKDDECIIDPACGSGGFLSECLRHIHDQIDKKGKKLGWEPDMIRNEKVVKIQKNIRGIERDAFLSKVAKSYMIILGDGKSGIVTEDALAPSTTWKSESQVRIEMGTFDIVITNPPFGEKIQVIGSEKLEQFELGHEWKNDKGDWVKSKLREKQQPQILFLERCMELLKEGGRMGIVLPDGILGNPTYGYIRHCLSKQAEILGIVDMPANAFRPSTNTKTHLLFLKKTKKPRENYDFFMSYAMTCGHDKRRRPIESDDVKAIPPFIKKLQSGKVKASNLGMIMKYNEIKDDIWLPKYYNLNIMDELTEYKNENYNFVSINELIDKGTLILLGSGNTVNADVYGEGDIPFIRTSDISNWDISEDPSHCIPEEEYERVKKSQDVKPEDILMVKDGTFLIGKTAFITELDTKIVLQSHFKRLRVLNKKKLSPYLLMGMLNTKIVRKQFDSKIFTQSSISTLGNRIGELSLPFPKSDEDRENLTKTVKDIINKKMQIKKLSKCNYLAKEQCLLGYKNNGHQGNL